MLIGPRGEWLNPTLLLSPVNLSACRSSVRCPDSSITINTQRHHVGCPACKHPAKTSSVWGVLPDKTEMDLYVWTVEDNSSSFTLCAAWSLSVSVLLWLLFPCLNTQLNLNLQLPFSRQLEYMSLTFQICFAYCLIYVFPVQRLFGPYIMFSFYEVIVVLALHLWSIFKL